MQKGSSVVGGMDVWTLIGEGGIYGLGWIDEGAYDGVVGASSKRSQLIGVLSGEVG